VWLKRLLHPGDWLYLRRHYRPTIFTPQVTPINRSYVIVVKRTSSIHVTTVSLMYGKTSVCRVQKQSSDGRQLCSVSSRFARTRSSSSRVRHCIARRHAPLPASSVTSCNTSSAGQCVHSETTSESSRHTSDCSTVHIIINVSQSQPSTEQLPFQFSFNARRCQSSTEL